MRILVLGGTAFLSSEIARQAVSAGHDVACLARGTAAEPPPGAAWLRGDRADGSRAYDEVRGDWDAVVDVARDPAQAGNALAALADHAAHWTFVSSCSAYADHGTPRADESAQTLAPLPDGTPYEAELYGEAKVAIEEATRRVVGDRTHIVRPGLIGGPGDSSDRYGYWPARLARSFGADQGAGPVLVPYIPKHATQVIDVRDLAAWVLSAAVRGVTGTFNAVGDVVPFGEYLAASQRLAALAVAGQTANPGEVPTAAGPAGALEEAEASLVAAGEGWLAEHGVAHWSGPDSMPLWLPPGHEGFCSRSNAAARDNGLVIRPWLETLRDTLDDELVRGVARPRKAGLSLATEQTLLAELAGS